MRLLVVTNLYEPDQAGGAVIYADFARAMAARGHDVTVRAAYPYFPEWKDKTARNGWRIWRYEEGGVHVERFGQIFPEGGIRSLHHRLLFEGSQLVSQLRSLPRGRFDVVMTFATHPGTTAAAAIIAAARRLPLLVSVQDLASDAAKATGFTEGRAAGGLERVERLLLRRANLLYGISPGMVHRIREMVVDRQVSLVPNWLHESLAQAIERQSAELTVGPERWRPDGTLRLFYSGNIGRKQDLRELCVWLAQQPFPFRFRIHAAGKGMAEIHSFLAECPDDRFVLSPLVSEDEFVRCLADADLFVVTERSGSGHSYLPSKLIPAMAMGTPILAMSDPDSSLGEEIRSTGAGIHRGWEQMDDLASALAAVSPTELAAWSEAALRRAQMFDRKSALDQIELDLGRLAQRPRRAAPRRRPFESTPRR